MKNKILISILIPTYNRPDYFKECIESVLEQKGFNNNELEFIVSDNSENNETKNIVKNYIVNNPEKKIIYNKNIPNIGPFNNFNKLLKLKKGKYFIFISDDDTFYNEKSLIKLYDVLIQNNADLSYGNNVSSINILHKSYQTNKNMIFDEHNIGFGGTLYKDYGFTYDIKAQLYTDYDFNINYVLNKKVIYINYNSLLYRIHKGQSINNISGLEDKKMKIYIFCKYKGYKYNIKSFIKIYILLFIIKVTNMIGIYNFILKIIKK